MASNHRYIQTSFWDDSYIQALDPIEKLAFLYLLTNPLTDLCGAYEISYRRIAFDTGIDSEMVKKLIERFEEHGKLKYRDGWLVMKNWLKHQKLNPNMIVSVENALTLCPSWVCETLTQWLPNPLVTIPHKNKNKNKNRNKKVEQEQPEPKRSEWADKSQEVFKFWTEILNKPSHKFTTERRNKVIARLKDGYSVDDLKTAIQGISLSPHNMGQNDRGVEYNDLELICRTGTHVEKYRDMKVKGVNTNGTNKQSNARRTDRDVIRESAEQFSRAYGSASVRSADHMDNSQQDSEVKRLGDENF